MKKTCLVLALLLLLLPSIAMANVYQPKCCKTINNYETNNYYNADSSEPDFPLYVGTELVIVPELGNGVFAGVTGAYYMNALDPKDFDAGMALVTIHINPWALRK